MNCGATKTEIRIQLSQQDRKQDRIQSFTPKEYFQKEGRWAAEGARRKGKGWKEREKSVKEGESEFTRGRLVPVSE